MLLSPCQIKYYGWKFRAEAHFGTKDSNFLRVCFCHQRAFMLLDGLSTPDLEIENVLILHGYFRILIQLRYNSFC